MLDMTREDALRLWVRELRSGKYSQGRGSLLRNGKYCCLGVICEELRVGKELIDETDGSFLFGGESAYLPVVVRNFLELGFDIQEWLVYMNDSWRASFKQIADFIEERLIEDKKPVENT